MAADTKSRIALVRKIQGAAFGTEDFVEVMGMQATTWRQRVFNSETALAFGLSKPAIPGVFGPLDVCMTGIVNMATFHHKVEMKIVAALVRSHWETLTKAIARAERDLWEKPGVLRMPTVPRPGQQFFAISSTSDKQASAGVGTMQAAVEQVDGPDRAIFMLDIQRVVRMAYDMARKTDVEFPARLCPDPDDAEVWRKWMDEIDDYLVATGHRKGKKRKAKAPA